jgi:poly(A) polymerase
LPEAFPEAARRTLLGHAELKALLAFVAAEQVELYLAGGAVRDLLLGLPACDLDLVSAAGLELARRFAAKRSLPFVMLDAERGVARVVVPGLDLDFSLFRGQAADIESDLLERDFSVNSMAVPFASLMEGRLQPLIDPASGLADLKKKKLRATTPHSLADDPLRALRLYRLAAQYGLAIEPATRRAAWAQAPNLAGVAGERIRAELVRLLGVRCAPQLRELSEGGLLGALLPGAEAMRGVEQRGYHHLDVLSHALATVERFEEVARRPGRYFPCPEELEPYLQEAPLWLLKLAALLHDVGKPEAATPAGGHVSFHRHEELGAEIAGQIAARLRLSRAECALLTRLTSLHMRPFHLVRLLRPGELSDRAVRRLIDAAGDDLPGLFLLALADSLAASGPEKPPDAERLLAELFCRASGYLREVLRPMRARPRLVSGDDLMEVFGLEPGPQVGELLAAIEDAYLEGEITSREEALAFASRLLKD